MSETAATAPTRDPLGEGIRDVVGNVGLRAGLSAAALLVIGTWATALGLSWLPGHFTAHALGVSGPGEHLTVGPRIAATLFAPWLSIERVSANQFHLYARSVPLLGAAISITFIVAAGLLVRRTISDIRGRVIALATASLVTATALGIASAFVSYEVANGSSGTLTIVPGDGSLFFVSILWVAAIGMFSFGIATKLHPPLRSALRTTGILVAGCAAAAALAFPVIVASWQPDNPTGNVYWSSDLAAGLWHWGSGIASVTVPLAFGASAHLPVATEVATPFQATTSLSTNSVEANLRLPRLAKYMNSHANARLTGYAGTGGTAAHALLLLSGALVVVLFLFAAIRTTRVLGAPRALDGLRQGALFGSCAFLFVLILKLLATSVITVRALGQSMTVRWGLDAGPLFQTGGELIAACGIAGMLYASFRPSPYRYQPLRLRFASALSTLWPTNEPAPASAADATTMVDTRISSSSCTSCGKTLDASDRFCPACGQKRADSTAE